jgi:hypothetical protein
LYPHQIINIKNVRFSVASSRGHWRPRRRLSAYVIIFRYTSDYCELKERGRKLHNELAHISEIEKIPYSEN